MTSGQHIADEDLALYAMQALPAPETIAMEAHLRACADCRRLLAETLGDLSLVGMSVDQQPVPDGARERFLARLAAESQPAAPKVEPAAPIVMQLRRRIPLPVFIPWAAAVLLAIVAGASWHRLHKVQEALNAQNYQLAEATLRAERAQKLMDVLTESNAQQVTLTEGKLAAAPTAHATYVSRRGALIFAAEHLRPIPESKTYELWVIPANGGAPIPAGIFRPGPNGTASVVLPPLPLGVPAKAFGVTIEKAGGSTTPTLPIVLSGTPGA